jgi:K+-sensing histidine kinase KdpD
VAPTGGAGGVRETTDGRLHIFLGAVLGAGKTYAMLAEASRRAALGPDVVVGGCSR